MDRIQIEASELWDLLFADSTAKTYQDTLNLTGTILKKTAQLIWLIICSVFVFGAWFSDTSVKTGQGIRTWVSQQGTETASVDPQSVADQGKSLLETGRNGISYLLNQAREQLGIEPQAAPTIKASTPKPVASAPAPTPAPAASTPAPAAPTPVASASTPAAFERPMNNTPVSTREAVDDGWPPQQED
jgi:hypothetical protein